MIHVPSPLSPGQILQKLLKRSTGLEGRGLGPSSSSRTNHVPLTKFLAFLVFVSVDQLVHQLISVWGAFQLHIQKVYGSIKFYIYKINIVLNLGFVLKRGEVICLKSPSELPEK